MNFTRVWDAGQVRIWFQRDFRISRKSRVQTAVEVEDNGAGGAQNDFILAGHDLHIQSNTLLPYLGLFLVVGQVDF